MNGQVDKRIRLRFFFQWRWSSNQQPFFFNKKRPTHMLGTGVSSSAHVWPGATTVHDVWPRSAHACPWREAERGSGAKTQHCFEAILCQTKQSLRAGDLTNGLWICRHTQYTRRAGAESRKATWIYARMTRILLLTMKHVRNGLDSQRSNENQFRQKSTILRQNVVYRKLGF